MTYLYKICTNFNLMPLIELTLSKIQPTTFFVIHYQHVIHFHPLIHF